MFLTFHHVQTSPAHTSSANKPVLLVRLGVNGSGWVCAGRLVRGLLVLIDGLPDCPHCFVALPLPLFLGGLPFVVYHALWASICNGEGCVSGIYMHVLCSQMAKFQSLLPFLLCATTLPLSLYPLQLHAKSTLCCC